MSVLDQFQTIFATLFKCVARIVNIKRIVKSLRMFFPVQAFSMIIISSLIIVLFQISLTSCVQIMFSLFSQIFKTLFPPVISDKFSFYKLQSLYRFTNTFFDIFRCGQIYRLYDGGGIPLPVSLTTALVGDLSRAMPLASTSRDRAREGASSSGRDLFMGGAPWESYGAGRLAPGLYSLILSRSSSRLMGALLGGE